MVKIINLWAQGIIVSVIITTIIEIILPEGNNKKYVKVILGIYILFSIIYPIINSISNGSVNLSEIINNANKQMEKYETKNITIETNTYIETTYKSNLKENISNYLNNKGYKVLNLNVYIETKDKNRYGQINSIVIELESQNDKVNEKINKIEQVDINVSNKNTTVINEQISEDEINKLKEYFLNTYSIEKEKIHINE